VGVAFALSALLRVIGTRVRMRGLGGAIRAIVRMILAAGIFVMAECHALTGYDRRHALDRNGQSQQQDSKKSEESSRHCRALYRELI
jgi:hypothetical protein